MPTTDEMYRGLRAFEQGVEFMASGDHQGAESRFREACTLVPGNESYWRHLGLCLDKQELFEEAEEPLRKASELAPMSALNWLNLGMILFKLDRSSEAEHPLRKACDYGANHRNPWEYLGRCLFELDRFAEAVEPLRRASKIEPTKESTWSLLGRCLRELDQFAEAANVLREACRIEPNSQANWLLLAASLKELGEDETEEAIGIYVRLIRDEPDTHVASVALNNLAIIHWNNADYASSFALMMEGIRVLRRLTKRGDIQPMDLEVYVNNLKTFIENLETHLVSPLLPTGFGFFLKQMWETEQRLLVRSDEVSVASVGYTEWLAAGSVWLDSASWSGREHSALLKELHASGAQWADPASNVFPEFSAGEEELDEALAFAENLSGSLRKEPDMPIHLDAADLRIAMTIENEHLRAWVGRETAGLAVSVNLKTWDVQYREDDPDAIFAVGAVLHWFLDCSGGIEHHPKFTRGIPTNEETVVPWRADNNTWSTNPSFHDDVEAVLSGRRKRPPKAHRVKGHIRTLSEHSPTEEARLRAPAYVRRNMGSNDTWVAGYSKGGEAALRSLITRLATFSSLADYLATCPRDEA